MSPPRTVRTSIGWLFRAATIALLAWLGGVGAALGQPAYPTRGIDIIIGFAPGGTTDLIARIMADYVGKKWSVPINVINKPGGNSVPAAMEVYKAAPDGYTLLGDAIGSCSMLAIDVPKLPFKVLDRTFISIISSNSQVIFVNPASPLRTVRDLVEDAKKDPEQFTWVGAGVASIPLRQLFRATGIDIQKTRNITSPGAVSASVLAAGGNVKVAISAVGPTLAPINSGLVRPIAVTTDTRTPSLPDVPTAREMGYPAVSSASWIGLTGPPGLPAHVVAKWSAEIQAMLKDPDIVAKLEKLASVPDYKDSQAFRAQVAREIQEFGELWGVDAKAR